VSGRREDDTMTRHAFALLLTVHLGLTGSAWALSDGGPGTTPGDGGASAGGTGISGEAQIGTGAATASIRIEVPPGRNGMQPNLALRYSSHGSAFSPYGVGWTLPIGSVERSRRYGVPRYSDADTFVVNLPDGVLDLVPITGGAYAARVDEAHVHVTRDKVANTWTLHDTSGRTYTFGCANCPATAGKGAAPRSFDDTFTWALVQVQDGNGNAVRYDWLQREGVVLPSTISWGGNGTLAHFFTVEFGWRFLTAAERALRRPVFANGYFQRLAVELQTITVRYRGAVVRRYTFAFRDSTATGNRLLERVRLAGANDAPLRLEGTAVDADTTFTYYERPSAYFSSTPTPIASTLFQDGFTWYFSALRQMGVAQYHGLVDLNADGRVDYVQSQAGNWRVWVNVGRANGIWQGSTPASCTGGDLVGCINDLTNCTGGLGCTLWPSPVQYVSHGIEPSCQDSEGGQCVDWLFPNNTTSATSDVNGDGLPDVINSAQTPWRLFVNTGAGFLSTPDGGQGSTKWTPSGPARELRGGPWQDSDDLPEDPTDYHPGPGTWTDLADVNGDGRPDVVSTKEWTTSDRRWRVWINNGDGFDAALPVPGPTRWLRNGGSAGTTSDGRGPVIQDMDTDLFDVNGDGIADKVRAMGNRNRTGRADCTGWHWEIWYGTGTDRGWVGVNGDQWEPFCWVSPPYEKLRKWNDDRKAHYDVVDVTGDGLPDFVHARDWSDANRNWVLYRNTGSGFVLDGGTGTIFAPANLRWHDTDHGTDDPPRYTDVLTDTIDVDGDGAVDVVKRGVGVWFGNPDRTKSDVLREVIQPTGHRQTFTYAVSSDFNDTLVDPAVRDGKLHLPFPVWVVSRIDETDGATYTHASTYAYGGGYYDAGERDFRGFHTTRRTDQRGVVETTTIHQGDVLRGKPIESATYAPGGTQLYKRTVSTWRCGGATCPTQTTLATRHFPELTALVRYDYSNASSNPYVWVAGGFKARASAFVYDACGNLVREVADAGTSVNPFAPSANANVSLATYATADADGTPINGCNATTRTCPTGYCNRATRLQELGGMTKTLLYHAGGNLKATRIEGDDDAHDATTSLEYGSYGLVARTTDPLGKVTEIVRQDGTSGYDADFLHPASVKTYATDGSTATVLWTARTVDARWSQPTAGVDENGATTRRVYDPFGRICKVYLPGDPYAPPADPCADAGNMAWDAPSERYVYAIYAGGSRVEKWAKVSTTRYVATVSFHDALGRPLQTQTTREVGGVEQVVVLDAKVYDAVGNVAVEWLTKAVPGAPNVTVRQDPTGDPGFRFHDPFGRLIDAYQADQDTYIRTTYQTAWVTRSCDPNASADATTGKCVEEERDFAGRTIERRTYVGGAGTWDTKEQRTYARDARTITVTYDNDATTAIVTAYDALGRKKDVWDPDAGASGSGRWRFDYDRAGNLVYQDDPKTGQHVELRYDGLGRLRYRYTYTADDPGAGTATEVTRIDYDCTGTTNGKGRACRLLDRGGTAGRTETLAYDARGHITRQKKTIRYQKPGAAQPVELSFTAESEYEPSTGRLLRSTYPAGNGASEWFWFVYGPTGGLQRVQTDGGEIVSDIEHDARGRLTQLEFRNGVVDRYTYKGADENHRLDRIETIRAGNAVPYRNVAYPDYDPNGNLRLIRDERFGPREGTSATATAVYEPQGRLTRARLCGGAPGSGWYESDFGYDPFGNLRLKDGNDAVTRPTKRHQFLTAESERGTVVEPITYDDNGSLLHLTGDRDAEYDAEGRLVRMSQNDAPRMQYAYDSVGARVVAWDATTDRTTFFFGGFDYHVEDRRIVRHVVAGRRLVAASIRNAPLVVADGPEPAGRGTLFAHGPTLFATIALVLVGAAFALPGRVRRAGVPRVPRAFVGFLAAALILVELPVPAGAQCPGRDGPTPADTVMYHLDHQGSPRLLTDHLGGVREYLGFEPYGTTGAVYGPDPQGVLQRKSTSESPFHYTGHRAADAAGLIFMGARFYDPAMGVFLTHDPAREFTSPYSYTGGNPFSFTDSTGAFIDVLIEIIFIVAIVAAVAQAIYTGVTAGLAASQSGESVGDAVLEGLGQAVLSLVISAVGIVIGAGIGQYLTSSAQLALQLASAGYGVYNGVQAIDSGNYGAGAFAILGAATALAGAAVTAVRIGNSLFAATAKSDASGATGGTPAGGACGGGANSCRIAQVTKKLSSNLEDHAFSAVDEFGSEGSALAGRTSEIPSPFAEMGTHVGVQTGTAAIRGGFLGGFRIGATAATSYLLKGGSAILTGGVLGLVDGAFEGAAAVVASGSSNEAWLAFFVIKGTQYIVIGAIGGPPAVFWSVTADLAFSGLNPLLSTGAPPGGQALMPTASP